MPLAKIWTEAGFIVEHTNAVAALQAVLTHAAICDAVAGGEHLKRAIEELSDG